MKKVNLILALFFALVSFVGCKDDVIDVQPTKSYPEGAIVWPKDTVVTLTDHYIVPKNKSLFIEEGAEIIMESGSTPLEIIVLGNLYCYGTASNPILFSVPVAKRNEKNRFDRSWGGIICGYDSKEVLLENTIIEYGGGQTTEESPSFQNQLFKTETGEGVPGFHFCNTDGQFVIKNCTFRFNAEDHIYITGGKSIIMNSTFAHNGFDGGDAINYKSDCFADLAYNFVYDANTNAFKMSNSGLIEKQSHIYIYNNTMVNNGWRRPKIKGGSVWFEDNCRVELYNNILFNNRHATKRDNAKPEDTRCIYTPNFLFASTQEGLNEITANESKGILVGASDKVSKTPGDNNPNFQNFTIQSTIDIMQGVSKSANVPETFNSTWDFYLKEGSPALTGGTTSIISHYSGTGLIINSIEYKSPAPSAYFGAFGKK